LLKKFKFVAITSLFFLLIFLFSSIVYLFDQDNLTSLTTSMSAQRNLTDKNDPFFVVFIATYNNETWAKINLESVFCQTYQNYRILCIEDHSKDNTKKIIEDYIKEKRFENKITFIANKERKGKLLNVYEGINSCKPNEIIVFVDGDDFLAHKNVLLHLSNIYKDPNVWVTYGQFRYYPSFIKGFAKQIPDSIIEQNKIRNYRWVTTHLKTFYAGLFHKIKKEDFMYNGQFFFCNEDQAYMKAMIEMAGKHSKFIDEVIYVYNNIIRRSSGTDIRFDYTSRNNIILDYINNQKKYQPVESPF
jgi:glycosyltransferase involved in cell wall biosynthesis